MTANKEAKRMWFKNHTKRVATETAIENAVRSSHIDSDEIKGRIIGRRRPQYRAWKRQPGIRNIVDDTPPKPSFKTVRLRPRVRRGNRPPSCPETNW
jgi:ribonuclease Y